MAARGRSITEVLQDIIGNVQDIVRSELRLARSELLQEIGKVKSAAPLLIGGGVAGLLATLFLMWTLVYVLALFVPMWAAALVVTMLLAATGSIMVVAALKRLRQVHPKPERTIENVKENVQWAKQQVK